MSTAGPLAEALLAARLLALAPRRLGGMALRGPGPARDLVVERLLALLGPEAPVRRLPMQIDDERLLGGIDLAASLALGRPVRQRGLLAEVTGGVLVVPLAERLEDSLAGRIAQAMEEDGPGFALLLLDDGAAPDEIPPAALRERVAFALDLAGVASLAVEEPQLGAAVPLSEVAPGEGGALAALAATATALGIGSARADHFAHEAARAHAALNGRRSIADQDLAAAARLVLAPRATRLPDAAPDEPAPEDEAPGQGGETDGLSGRPLDDRVLEAAQAALPADLLARLAAGQRAARGRAGGKGRKTVSRLRGRPLGARPGVPRGGARLALVDTLRAAVPWQALRRAEEGKADAADRILIRKGDLRVRRFQERTASVTIFCVDASGSAAMARLAEAKGAVELMLAQAYVRRSEVALIAFRGEGAELLLAPTRSLTRARRELAQLPGGGGTPLASGIAAAQRLAEAVSARGRTPQIVVLTDGSANIAADGTPGRGQAREDALAAARRLAGAALDTLVLDIAPRPRPEATEIAAAMRARYLALPLADARTLATLASQALAPGARAA